MGQAQPPENVVCVFGGQPIGRQPNGAAVDALAELLEMAQAGEIKGVAVAAIHWDNLASARLAGQVGGYSAIGALEVLKADLADINRAVIEE